MVILILAAYSCSELQEPSLDAEIIEVFIPRDSLRTDILSQEFYWYELRGAMNYHFQIAQPSFKYINRLLKDTIMEGTRIKVSLPPGEYEWRVRAFNNSSATDFTLHKLFIDSIININNQELLLSAPLDEDTSNNLSATFKWQSLFGADSYRFEIATSSDFSAFIYSQVVKENRLNYMLDNEGSYNWRVRAQNNGSTSLYSQRSFFIDTTAPFSPLLSLPIPGATYNAGTNITFQWESFRGAGASIKDSVLIASDSLFTQVVVNKELATDSLQVSNLQSGQYYWKVKSVDGAGNQSPYSEVFNLTVF
jgi:hypothetical protein